MAFDLRRYKRVPRTLSSHSHRRRSSLRIALRGGRAGERGFDRNAFPTTNEPRDRPTFDLFTLPVTFVRVEESQFVQEESEDEDG